jgi:hypothetical protein
VTLAYVFSHRPADGVDIADYEIALKRFHASLGGSPPVGFLGSSTFRTGDRYSDWYLVESSAALDFLNEAAVSGAEWPSTSRASCTDSRPESLNPVPALRSVSRSPPEWATPISTNA